MRPYQLPRLAAISALDEDVRACAKRQRRSHQDERECRSERPVVEAGKLAIDDRPHHLEAWAAQKDHHLVAKEAEPRDEHEPTVMPQAGDCGAARRLS